MVTILCTQPDFEQVSGVLFEHSSTFGLRWQTLNRKVLNRHWESIETQWGSIRMKVGSLNGRVMTRSPEYEDVRKCADAHGVSLKTVINATFIGGNE